MQPRREPLLWLQCLAIGIIPLELLLIRLLLAGADPGPVPPLERLLLWAVAVLAPAVALWRRPADWGSLLLVRVPLTTRTKEQQQLSGPQGGLTSRLVLLVITVGLLPLIWWMDESAGLVQELSPVQERSRLVTLLLSAPLLALIVWQVQQLVQAILLLASEGQHDEPTEPLDAEQIKSERSSFGLPLLRLQPLNWPEPATDPEPVAKPEPTTERDPTPTLDLTQTLEQHPSSETEPLSETEPPPAEESVNSGNEMEAMADPDVGNLHASDPEEDGLFANSQDENLPVEETTGETAVELASEPEISTDQPEKETDEALQNPKPDQQAALRENDHDEGEPDEGLSTQGESGETKVEIASEPEISSDQPEKDIDETLRSAESDLTLTTVAVEPEQSREEHESTTLDAEVVEGDAVAGGEAEEHGEHPQASGGEERDPDQTTETSPGSL